MSRAYSYLEWTVQQDLGSGPEDVTYLLGELRGTPPRNLPTMIPMVSGFTRSPAQIGIAEGFGFTDSSRFTLTDHMITTDSNLVKGGTPPVDTTFLRLLRARVENAPSAFVNKEVITHHGVIDDLGEYTETVSRTYLTRRFTGPNPDDKWILDLTDKLTLSFDVKAKAPIRNQGTLLNSISAGDVTADIEPASEAANYPTSGFLRFSNSDEFVSFTRVAEVLTLTRGVLGTTAESHAAGDLIQTMLRYENEKISVIIYDLLVNFAGLPASLIDQTAWDLENDTWLDTYRLTTTIWDSVGIKTLIEEMLQQFPVLLYNDLKANMLRFDAIKPGQFDVVTTLTSSNIVKKTLSIVDDPTKAFTSIQYYFGQVDPKLALNEVRNYSTVFIDFDTVQITARGEDTIKTVFSRWLGVGDSIQAVDAGRRLLQRISKDQRRVSYELVDRLVSLSLGDQIRLEQDKLLDPLTEMPAVLQLQVIAEDDVKFDGQVVSYVCQDLRFDAIFGLYSDDTVPDITAGPTADELATYVWYADDNDLVNAGTEPGKSYF